MAYTRCKQERTGVGTGKIKLVCILLQRSLLPAAPPPVPGLEVAALFQVGLATLALHWFWAPFFFATSVASSMEERALAVRLRRETGCSAVHFRRDGVVLYGTGLAPRPLPAVNLWVTSLVTSAGWMLLVFVSGRGLIEAVDNAAYALRGRFEILPYRYDPRWLSSRARHRIWVRGRRLRIEVASAQPEARDDPASPNPPAAGVGIAGAAGSDRFALGEYTVTDGHVLISGPDGTYLLQRGSRRALRPPPASGSVPLSRSRSDSKRSDCTKCAKKRCA